MTKQSQITARDGSGAAGSADTSGATETTGAGAAGAAGASGGRPPAGRPSYRESLRRLASAQKSGKGAPAYSRFVNRGLGRLLAAAAHVAGMTPNGVTAVSGTLSFAGIALLALVAPSWWLGVAVTLLLVVGYALDAADGQLARLRGGGSVAGEWLDHMIDCVKISSLHLAVLVGMYRFTDLDEGWLLVPIGYTVVASASFFAQILNEQLRKNRVSAQVEATTAGQARPSVVLSLLKVPTDYGLLCLIFLALGAGETFYVLYGLMFLASAGYLALALVRWFLQMATIDKGGAV